LGNTYSSLSNEGRAIEYYKQHLAIARAIKDRKGEGNALGNLGSSYSSQGNYTKGIEYHEQSLAIAREIKDRHGEGRSLGNLGNVYRSQGKYAKATESYQQHLAIAREIKDRQGEGNALSGLGSTDLSQGNYARAIDYYEQSLAIKREIKDRQGEGAALGNLGIAYDFLGKYAKAIGYYEQHLAIARAIKDRQGEGNALGNLEIVYKSLGNYAKAIEYHQQSLAVAREIKDRKGEGRSLGNLGNAYDSLENYAKAIESHEQSLAILREIKDRQGEGAALGNLGLVYASLGDYAKATEYYEQYLLIARTIEDREGEGIALGNLGYALNQRQQPELAILFYKQSVNVRESIRQDLRKLPRESQEAYTQSVADTYRSLTNLLIEQGRLPEAQAVLELLKLRELRDFTRDAGINSTGISLAKVEEAAFQEILKRFTTVGNFSQRIAECEQKACSDDVQQLKAQRDQLNTAINQELNQQRSILAKYFATEGSTLTPEKLNAEARRIVNAEPGTVLIYPLILKDKIQFLLALKAGDGAVTFRPFETRNVSATQLFNTIQTFRNQLKNPGDLKALQATSKQLYDWLIKPLEPELNNPTIKHLVFAPDSTTRYIPLAALFDGKHYLIERYTITTITAASQTNTTDRLPKPIANQPFLLAMGASVFANASPLDNVPAELDAITQTANGKDSQGIYPGTELLNTAFDYAALKQHLPGTRILHIATHGKFVPGRPEDSFLLPGRGENITTTLIDQLGNYGIGDVHLVVLSACETAVGDRASDGIEIPGISYFFLKNDVKAVLASLWSVNDASTSLIMQQFYKNLSTRSKAEALREVQQQFITGQLTAKDAPSRATLIVKGSPQTRQNASSDFTHPFYWAPFILIGNGL